MKKWVISGELKIKNAKFKIDDLIDVLLENRGVKTAKEKDEFLHPKLKSITPKGVGINLQLLKKALTRIHRAIDKQEQIVVFGDYDVDGITGTAILWETLHSLGANVFPYIPHRIEEGYGLSIAGISNIKNQIAKINQVKLIITTDNGIVANEAVTFANEQGIDVIITDHHTIDAKLPDAYAIVHTTKLCGAGVAYLLAKEIKNQKSKIKNDEEDRHLELATLGTIADMVPLTGANRAIVKFGLERLPKSNRLGLQALYRQSGLNKDVFTPYEIGFIIAPRLNASGRIESAMDSLRLLCTLNRGRAEELAAKLEFINKERQLLLKDSKQHASSKVRVEGLEARKLLFVAHESYAQGVIGLVAGKLVEEFYRPAIVVSISERHSKASVRSINGFNIIEFLRMHKDHFVNVGGHPMAAGFTVDTEKLVVIQQMLEKKAEELLTDDLLVRVLKIDCDLPFSSITKELFDAIQQLTPFGIGNPEPIFATHGVTVEEVRIMGKDGSHLKVILKNPTRNMTQETRFEAVGFGMGALASKIHQGDTIDVAYTIDENVWNGNTKLQLKLKDLRSH